jgi:hypothetical protein
MTRPNIQRNKTCCQEKYGKRMPHKENNWKLRVKKEADRTLAGCRLPDDYLLVLKAGLKLCLTRFLFSPATICAL